MIPMITNDERISLLGAYCRSAQTAAWAAREVLRLGYLVHHRDDGLCFAASAVTALAAAEALAAEIDRVPEASGALRNLECARASVEAARVQARTLRY